MMVTKREEAFDERYAALEAYAAREGDTRVPASYIQEDGIKLGAWVSYLRTRYSNDKLSAERVNRLEELPGWEWGPLTPGPKSDAERDAEIRANRSAWLPA